MGSSESMCVSKEAHLKDKQEKVSKEIEEAKKQAANDKKQLEVKKDEELKKAVSDLKEKEKNYNEINVKTNQLQAQITKKKTEFQTKETELKTTKRDYDKKQEEKKELEAKEKNPVETQTPANNEANQSNIKVNIKDINGPKTSLILPDEDYVNAVAQNLEKFELEDIRDSKLKHIDIINKAKNLKTLNLSWKLGRKDEQDDSHLNSIQLKELTKLTHLSFNMHSQKFSETALITFADDLKNLVNLEVLELDLTKMKKMGNPSCEAIFKTITGLKNLTKLDFIIHCDAIWQIKGNYQILTKHIKRDIWTKMKYLVIKVNNHEIPKEGTKDMLKALVQVCVSNEADIKIDYYMGTVSNAQERSEYEDITTTRNINLHT